MLVVVEGLHDIAFLRGLSQRLSAEDSNLPQLAQMEARGELIFLPTGGSDLASWSQRLAPLGCAEFHLYDREQSPETEVRRQVIAQVLQRPRCHAVLTGKRTLENYLHPTAIQRATGMSLAFSAHEDVAALFARQRWQDSQPPVSWDQLSRRAQKRLANHAKRVLNGPAVMYMSRALLGESDAAGEVYAWYRAIKRLAE